MYLTVIFKCTKFDNAESPLIDVFSPCLASVVLLCEGIGWLLAVCHDGCSHITDQRKCFDFSVINFKSHSIPVTSFMNQNLQLSKFSLITYLFVYLYLYILFIYYIYYIFIYTSVLVYFLCSIFIFVRLFIFYVIHYNILYNI